MKKILTLAVAFAVIQFTASAQTQRTDGSKAKAKTSTMQKGKGLEKMEGLDLTKDQRSQIAVIQQDTRTKAAAIKASNVSETEKQQQMKDLRAASKVRMDAVLTANQKALLEARKAENKKADKMDGKKHGKKQGEMHGKKKGKMDDERKDKMKERYENMSPETRARLKAIREDKTLTQDQKKEAVRKIMMENKANKAAAKTNKS
jgi:Spy/CpxP family protein refolding chaperone